MLPIIQAAKNLDIYTITCDYLPNNIAHKYSDEYHDVSIIEKEKVLSLADDLHVDGIMSFACDPGVETAAYVAEKLGLPNVGPYKSVSILQNKALFRKFLADNNFNVPKARSYRDLHDAMSEIGLFHLPLIIKPVDSAGSKGVTKIDDIHHLASAVEDAIKFSKTRQFIIEEYIDAMGCPSDTDALSIDGNLVYISFNDQYFDAVAKNPFTPAAFSWPTTMLSSIQQELQDELQRLITLLGMRTAIYNIETRQGRDGRAYIMEVSPRGGGNRLAEMLRYSTGVDLIKYAVVDAVGNSITDEISEPVYHGSWAEVVLHSKLNGKFQGLKISRDLKQYVFEEDVWIRKGDIVNEFTGANETIGTLVLRFPNLAILKDKMLQINKLVQVVVE